MNFKRPWKENTVELEAIHLHINVSLLFFIVFHFALFVMLCVLYLFNS